MQNQQPRRRGKRTTVVLGVAALLLSGIGAGIASADEAPRPIAPDTLVPYNTQDSSYRFDTELKKFVPLAVDEKEEVGVELVNNLPVPAALNPGATLSNLVFWDHYAAQGSYNGFAIYDIANPELPVLLSTTVCPGYQGDLSRAGDLLFFSVDQPRNGSACGAPSVAASNVAAWEGIRIFDVSDVAAPAYVGNVGTRCGSHTHTLVPNPEDEGSVYLYNGSYDSSTTAAYCKNPHLQVEVIKVDLDDPASAAVVKNVALWDEDPNTELPAPFKATDRTNGGAATTATVGCHDMTAYPAKNLLAAACEGDGLLIDIEDPLNPVVLDRDRDANFAFWHTAQFNNDATKMIFQDELGGGSSATCVPGTPNYRGVDSFYSVADGQMTLESYFKIPRRQTTTENCVVHEGNILPVPDKDIFVQAWYQGGVSVIDFTDIKKPTEIAYFDRGPISATSLVTGGYWATYFKDGYIFGSEIARGFDTLKLTGEGYEDAMRYKYPNPYNPASQPEYVWGWKDAPVVPATVPAATVSPASVSFGAGTTVTVSAPAGTYDAAEYVDVWSTGSDAAVVADTKAAADGSFSASFEIPADTPVGTVSYIVRGDTDLDADLLKATVSVTAWETATTITLSQSAKQVYGGTPSTLTATVVTAGGPVSGGTLVVRSGPTVIATGVPVSATGTASVALRNTLSVKTHPITATYVPAQNIYLGSVSASKDLVVSKASSVLTATLAKATIKATEKGKISVTVTATGTVPTGTVRATTGWLTKDVTLSAGKATLTLPVLAKGTHSIKLSYLGSDKVKASAVKTVTLKVTS